MGQCLVYRHFVCLHQLGLITPISRFSTSLNARFLFNANHDYIIMEGKEQYFRVGGRRFSQFLINGVLHTRYHLLGRRRSQLMVKCKMICLN